MYIILTSKDGEYVTEAGPEVEPVEVFDYYFYGQHKATFVISRLQGESRLRVRSLQQADEVNTVPTKFMEKFSNIEAARKELATLTSFGSLQTQLVLRA